MLAAPRDRWFLGEGLKRTGPLDFDQLIRWLLGQADPRAPLVWHKGFTSWTRAEDVPQVERRLAPVLARAANAEATRLFGSNPPILAQTGVAAIENGAPGSPALVYGSLAAGVIALALVGWLLWPRPQPVPLPVVILPAPTPTPSAPITVPAPHAPPGARPSPAPAVSARPASAFDSQEAELPTAEVRKLRGVAAWSGENLELAVENPTAWRVTELRVRVSRFDGDDLVQDAAPVVLLPPVKPVAPGLADLLDRVAPDRRRPGVNPLDTGSFEAKAGPCPEAFRWEIESARGYAPLELVERAASAPPAR